MSVIVDTQGHHWPADTRDDLIAVCTDILARGETATPELLRARYGYTLPYLRAHLFPAVDEAEKRLRLQTRRLEPPVLEAEPTPIEATLPPGPLGAALSPDPVPIDATSPRSLSVLAPDPDPYARYALAVDTRFRGSDATTLAAAALATLVFIAAVSFMVMGVVGF